MTLIGEYHSNRADASNLGDGNPLAVTTNEAQQPGIFDRAEWFALLRAHVAPDAEPLTVCVEEDGATLRLYLLANALHPFEAASPGTVSALAHWYSFAWRPVWTGQPDAATKLRLATTAAAQLRGKGHRLHLNPVPAEDGSADLLATALRAAGWQVELRPDGVNHWLDTKGRSFADWWAARPGALRSTVQRKAKKGLVALAIHSDFDDRLWDDYETVYRASWKPPEGHPELLRAWAKQQADEGTLRLGIARIEGAPVAAQFWTTDSGHAYIHKLAHVAGHDMLSPGTLLTHALFERAFDEGVTRIDFGTGDDGYKRDWMEESAPLMAITALDPASPRAWPLMLRRTIKPLVGRLRAR